MTSNPALHKAPIGYGRNGPLTWVAECRVPWESPGKGRLAMAQWMIDNGSDVHQGGDGPLMRAALMDYRIPMMELLLANGADVNAEWNGGYPIIFAPCETVQPASLKWLLDHGAEPNCAKTGHEYTGTALDQVIGTYSRSSRLGECIDILIEAGGVSKYQTPAILDLLRGRLDLLTERLDADPALLHLRFPDLDFGNTAERRLTLAGATLLHVAAEYGNAEAANILLDRGADVNVRAIDGQTPIFHSVTQVQDWRLAVTKALIERGADLSVRVKLPGHYERPNEVVECSPLEYALMFPADATNRETIALLR